MTQSGRSARSLWRRWLAHQDGATAVEYAIVAPMFFMFVFGTLEAGRLVWMQLTLDRAVAMAARCAAVNPSVCGTAATVRAYAVAQAPGVTFPATAFNVATSTAKVCVTGGYTVTFAAKYIYGPSAALKSSACFPV